MTAALIALLFAIQAAAAPAAPSTKPKTRTIQQLINLAMAEGEEYTMKPTASQGLGFEQTVKTKKIYYRTPDNFQHSFFVVISDSKKKPNELLWRTSKISEREPGRYFDAWTYRSSLTGTLRAATYVSGPDGHVTQDKLALDSKTKDLFEKEKVLILVLASASK